MDESLRIWCLESLAAARERLYRSLELKNVREPMFEAENAVDTAAFERMSSERGIKCRLPFLASSSARDVVKSLAMTCPLNQTSPPEVLASIHEYLVTLRCASGKGRRRSESRKANGIFYTPSYVVDEIVHRTIGPRLEHVAFSDCDQIRILDPAAGSGAFLVAAFRYLIQWHVNSLTSRPREAHSCDVMQTQQGWKLSFQRCHSILINQLFGVDLDATAIEVTRRILWLTLVDSSADESGYEPTAFFEDELAANFKHGNSLVGSAFETVAEIDFPVPLPGALPRFDWSSEFPEVSRCGGFDVVIGNPPYRRERDFKRELDLISVTPLGRRHRTARMDLWYYFLHRGIQLLKTGGCLSFITNAYWIHGTGAEKLIATLRDEVHLDELFLLRNQPVFPGVSAQHVILRITKISHEEGTTIKVVPHALSPSARPFLTGEATVRTFVKTKHQLFRDGRLDVMPAADALLEKLNACSRLSELGSVRQGIAENPAAINRRTLERFREDPSSAEWLSGEGVFSLQAQEVARLALQPHEAELLRPYHDLCDLQRYWVASQPSRQLIYSTRRTCPEISEYPTLCAHLSRFRVILEARRETRHGNNCWWHLHWPRDDRIWRAEKLVVLQMAIRPSFVPMFRPSYVPFSTNVFVPASETREDLRYLCGLLNSRLLWGWFSYYAKRRGVGLELNGHILEKSPIRRIDFDDPLDVRQHAELVCMVDQRMKLSALQKENDDVEPQGQNLDDSIREIELQMDSLVASLYGLNPADIELIDQITSGDNC